MTWKLWSMLIQMRCETASEWMSLYLDGQLAPSQVAFLGAHLSNCEACRREWAALHQVATILSDAPVVMPRPGFAERVIQRLGRERARCMER